MNIENFSMLNYFSLFLFLLFFQSYSFAEYRAYQYLLGSKNSKQKALSIMTTSLNPVAMSKYYGISKDQLYLLRTWICPGNTAKRKICTPVYQESNLEQFNLQENSNGDTWVVSVI